MDTRSRGPLSESEICTLHDFSALISRELNASPSAGARQDAGDSAYPDAAGGAGRVIGVNLSAPLKPQHPISWHHAICGPEFGTRGLGNVAPDWRRSSFGACRVGGAMEVTSDHQITPEWTSLENGTTPTCGAADTTRSARPPRIRSGTGGAAGRRLRVLDASPLRFTERNRKPPADEGATKTGRRVVSHRLNNAVRKESRPNPGKPVVAPRARLSHAHFHFNAPATPSSSVPIDKMAAGSETGVTETSSGSNIDRRVATQGRAESAPGKSALWR